MQKELFEKYYRVLGILLLVLAPINAWAAYALYPEHPIMALANGAVEICNKKTAVRPNGSETKGLE